MLNPLNLILKLDKYQQIRYRKILFRLSENPCVAAWDLLRKWKTDMASTIYAFKLKLIPATHIFFLDDRNIYDRSHRNKWEWDHIWLDLGIDNLTWSCTFPECNSRESSDSFVQFSHMFTNPWWILSDFPRFSCCWPNLSWRDSWGFCLNAIIAGTMSRWRGNKLLLEWWRY